MDDAREVVECVRIGSDERSACSSCCCRDLKVVGSSRLPGAACVCEQRGVVAGDVEVERDDLDALDHPFHSFVSTSTVLIVGKLDADK
jgi:hypothetical protein